MTTPPPASTSRLKAAARLLRSKERRAAGLFLAEGPQAVREARAEDGRVKELFVTAEASIRHRELISGSAPTWLVTDAELARLTDAVTPQGLVAVCSAVDHSLDETITSRTRLVVCCAQVSDPGNAGTVIRCADAFGAEAVILSRESVDPYNPKTVRASVGSVFHLPIVRDVTVADSVRRAREVGLQVLAADGSGESLTDLAAAGALTADTLWLFGNEAHGLSPDLLALADRTVAVPIRGAAESLNLATAAAICLHTSATAQSNP